MEEQEKQGWVESLLGAIGPQEAEAFPWGKIGKRFIKRGAKGVVTKGVSSAEKGLIGKTVFGKTVRGVVKGRGDLRYIRFTDGTERVVSKDVLTELMQEVGATKYLERFAEKEGPSKLEQAAKSLRFHKARQSIFATKKLQGEWLKTRQAHAKAMGQEPTPYVWVESERVFMPKGYAEVLDSAGVVKIRKKR